jgi:hypothetical protein
LYDPLTTILKQNRRTNVLAANMTTTADLMRYAIILSNENREHKLFFNPGLYSNALGVERL